MPDISGRVLHMPLSKAPVLGGEISDRGTPDESRVELEKNFRAKHCLICSTSILYSVSFYQHCFCEDMIALITSSDNEISVTIRPDTRV